MERAAIKTESGERGRMLFVFLHQLGFEVESTTIIRENETFMIEYSGKFPGGQGNLDAYVQGFQYQHGPFTFDLGLEEDDWHMTEKDIIGSLEAHGLRVKSKGKSRYEITCDGSYDDTFRALGAFIDDNIWRVSP